MSMMREDQPRWDGMRWTNTTWIEVYVWIENRCNNDEIMIIDV